MTAQRHFRNRIRRTGAALALALAAQLCLAAQAPSAQAGKPAPPVQAECQAMQELYRACHKLGGQTDSPTTCREAAQDLLQRAITRGGDKNALSTRALAELVCATGCEDALAGQPPATPQEFAEAFCEPAPKTQGARP